MDNRLCGIIILGLFKIWAVFIFFRYIQRIIIRTIKTIIKCSRVKRSQITDRGFMDQVTFQQRTDLINWLIFVCQPFQGQLNIPSIIQLIIQLNFWLSIKLINSKIIAPLTKIRTLLATIHFGNMNISEILFI